MNRPNFEDFRETPITYGTEMEKYADFLEAQIESQKSAIPIVTQWVAVEDENLPPIDEPVWLYERGYIFIGCRFYTEGTWMWARNYDGVNYDTKEWNVECEMDDIQPTKWAKLPEPPCG